MLISPNAFYMGILNLSIIRLVCMGAHPCTVGVKYDHLRQWVALKEKESSFWDNACRLCEMSLFFCKYCTGGKNVLTGI